jgi:large subunit ribosomal protein L30
MAKKSVQKPKQLRIKLVKSPIGYSQRHKDTIRTLGLRKINQEVVRPDSPILRGMLLKVAHLVTVEEVESDQ